MPIRKISRSDVAKSMTSVVQSSLVNQAFSVAQLLHSRGYSFQLAPLDLLSPRPEVRLLEPIQVNPDSVVMISIGINCVVNVRQWRHSSAPIPPSLERVLSCGTRIDGDGRSASQKRLCDWISEFPFRKDSLEKLREDGVRMESIEQALQAMASETICDELLKFTHAMNASGTVAEVYADAGWFGSFEILIREAKPIERELTCGVVVVASVGLARGTREEWEGEYY